MLAPSPGKTQPGSTLASPGSYGSYINTNVCRSKGPFKKRQALHIPALFPAVLLNRKAHPCLLILFLSAFLFPSFLLFTLLSKNCSLKLSLHGIFICHKASGSYPLCSPLFVKIFLTLFYIIWYIKLSSLSCSPSCLLAV